MTLPTSGALSLNAIHVEAGGSSGTQVSLNDEDIRDMALVLSNGSNSFNSYYGGKRAFARDIVVGFGNINNAETQYDPASVTRTRGYSDGEFSNRTPATYGTLGVGSTQYNSESNPLATPITGIGQDYIDGKRVSNVMATVSSTTSSSTHTSSSVIFRVSDDDMNTNTPNDDNAFKRLSIGGHVFARSAATYSGFSGGTTNQDVQWIWTHTFSPAQSFTNDSVAIQPFTAVGTSSRLVVAAT
tara:strand:- start:63 stop:788 length:726 start_codon:yes stop_codon:yes gene_type:complete